MVKLRQYIAGHKVEICIIVIVLVLVSLLAFGVRRYGWTWTGFADYTTTKSDTEEFHPYKRLWDWMELLIIPLVLVVGGFLLNRAQRQRELDIAKDREEERALQNYLEAMTELLLEKKLSTPEGGWKARSIARARTLTILRSLSSERKSSILRFLYEAELIDSEKTVINLEGANLEGVNLEGAFLRGAFLRGAFLRGAFLRGADLGEADLRETNLEGVNLEGAFLRGANLRRACLKGAKLSEDSILPDGTKWTLGTEMARFTDPDDPDFWQPDA